MYFNFFCLQIIELYKAYGCRPTNEIEHVKIYFPPPNLCPIGLGHKPLPDVDPLGMGNLPFW